MLNTMYIYIYISDIIQLSIFANGWTYTATSISIGIAPFLPEHSGFISSEATDPLTDETTSGTGRKGSHLYLT